MIEIIPNWHPVFVHFTVALFSTSILFYVLSILVPASEGLKTNWHLFARWCLWIGMVFTLITIPAGYQAYNTVAHDTPSHLAMTEHGYWAYTTATLFAALTVWSIWLHRKKEPPGKLFLLLALICGGLLLSTAWRGGELVYRYGLGVMSMPTIEKGSGVDHGSHSHGEDSGSSTAHSSSGDKTSSHHKANDKSHDDDKAPSEKNINSETNSQQPSKTQKNTHDSTPHAH